MIASRVSVDNLNNSLLSYKRKRKLRREAIKSYIRAQPAGTPIASKELIAAGQFKSYPNGWRFLADMVKDKTITREKVIGSHKAIYTVRGDSQVVVPSKRASLEEVVSKAKDWAWEHDSNDLREFIKSLKVGVDGC